MTAIPAPGAFPAYDRLIEAAAACERLTLRTTGEEPARRRAWEVLVELSSRCRDAARALLTDPTLITEPVETGRFRAVDLLVEMVGQLIAELRACLRGAGSSQVRADTRGWGEVERLYDAALHLAEIVSTIVPHRDYATQVGAQAISRARLAIHHLALRRAAESVQSVLAAAAAVAHPDPLVIELDTLACTLADHAHTLARFRQAETRAQAAALGLRDFDQQD
ncbi:hypothetical protein ACFQ68_00140 [Amycolatopsis japonica]|uniref:hypothetical protein n=1 Tax=Amycolatopsis japonica TaxID=208439 RepID=UPI00366C4306